MISLNIEGIIGYELNDSKQCQSIQPFCNIENSQVQGFGWTRFYFLEENFDLSTKTDSTNKEYKLAQTKVINGHLTAFVLGEDGTIIHLWLINKDVAYIIKSNSVNQSKAVVKRFCFYQIWKLNTQRSRSIRLAKDIFIQVKSQNQYKFFKILDVLFDNEVYFQQQQLIKFLGKTKAILENQLKNKFNSSIEIIEKKNPLKCQKKIKVTKKALERFIKRTFIIISDDEGSINYNGNKKNQTQQQVNNQSSSRSSSILSSSSGILQQYEKRGKKEKQQSDFL
ncbi:unnamed protein product [Paramecium sonneborni]|uniref:Uncharacterized protein n=1 Tax=Paramecium sonneborni TaxID=65129 RepID=A0A8S1RT60_9CILI|nr:unnamed protein product [Paramecium sonneborni]